MRRPFPVTTLPTEEVLGDLGAGKGNRTPVSCLEGRCSTIELYRQIWKEEQRGLEPTLVGKDNHLSFGHPPSSPQMKATRPTAVNLVLVGLLGLEPRTIRL